MKKVRVLGIVLLFSALTIFLTANIFAQNVIAHADELLNETLLSINGLFSKKTIEETGYLYNLDESADYVYVDFAGCTGYAIFAEETMELLEYATVGEFPYLLENNKKYYGGPRAYFIKTEDQFINTVTNEQLSLLASEVEVFSQSMRQTFMIEEKPLSKSAALNDVSMEKVQNLMLQNIPQNKAKGLGVLNNISTAPMNPPLDEGNWISPTSGATYIPNSEYFLTPGQAPMHGLNSSGSCTTVATQLLLSYNNFYNDRRIIAPQHLYGGWNNNTGNGNIFDSNNYTNPEWNPNVSTNLNSMTSRTLGANQAHHDMLLNNNITGFLSVAAENLRNHLNTRGINFTVESQTATTLPIGLGKFKTIASTNILAEINSGRPVVLATADNLNGTKNYDEDDDPNTRTFNHSVIAYGYQTFAAYGGNGNANEYLGYIVHMGWDPNGNGNNINIWTNSAWYYSYISLEINHTHNYSVPVGGEFNEHRCSVCGHRTNTPFADGQLVQTPDGSIFLMVGGSPLAISFNFLTNVLGSPQTVRISYATFNCLPQYPADGTYVFDGASIFEFVGGAPLPISNVYWVDIIGIQPCIRVDGWSLMRYSGVGCVRRYPADGTYVYDGGSVYEFVGGAPLGISYVYWVNLMGSHSCVRVDNWSLTRYSGIGSVNQHPADNTYVHTLYGDTYYFITQHAYLDNTWTGHTTLVDTYSLQPYL